jgi:hypothetical protein
LFLYQDHRRHDDAALVRRRVRRRGTGKLIWKRGPPRDRRLGLRRRHQHQARATSSSSAARRRVAAYTPETGKDLWSVRGMTFEVIPTPGRGPWATCSARQDVRDRRMAIRPGGSGDVT